MILGVIVAEVTNSFALRPPGPANSLRENFHEIQTLTIVIIVV